MWQPSASIENLKKRAVILAKIRQFFADRGVWEVETPLLAPGGITDPCLHSASTILSAPSLGKQRFYFQTSPEFHMKRLLAAGSGSIYQISKVCRDEELGKWHNPEFTMLEWYRIGFDDHQLMAEVDELLQAILSTPKADKISYQNLFLKYCDVDPLYASLEELKATASHFDLDIELELSRDGWLQYILSHIIEPQLGQTQPLFLYDYPRSQAALARVRGDVAERFEVYFHGIELGNGFHELADAKLQRQRFEEENAERAKMQLPIIPIDEKLLAALDHGFPNCAGIAIGIDRLMMLALKQNTLADVISFSGHYA